MCLPQALILNCYRLVVFNEWLEFIRQAMNRFEDMGRCFDNEAPDMWSVSVVDWMLWAYLRSSWGRGLVSIWR